jgi:hypothetical protein
MIGRTGFSAARHVVRVLGVGLVLIWLTHSMAAQDDQRQPVPPEVPVDPFQALNLERALSVPNKVPDFAPTQPWWGELLPDGQPHLPSGIWRIHGAGVRYLDVPSPGFFMASRVVDPPDGKVPYQPWALELKKTMPDDVQNPTKPWHIDSTARCLNTVPRLMYYVTEYEIVQSPGSVVFHFQLEHIARVIPSMAIRISGLLSSSGWVMLEDAGRETP